MKKIFKSILSVALVFAMINVNTLAADVSDFYSEDLQSVEGSVAASPEENLFTPEGSGDAWILLDASEDGLFVLKDKSCSNQAFDTGKTAWIKFDAERTTNIAYIMNGEKFIDTYIPKTISNNMIESDWEVAPDASSTEPYIVRSRLTLLSAAEYAQYYEKIGYDCGTGWYLRDPYPNSKTSVVEVASKDESKKAAGKLYAVGGYAFNKRGIRPACMLDGDFFKNARIEIDSIGENVLNYIKSKYTKEELSLIYDETELKMIFEGVKIPKVENLKLTGENKVGYPIGYSYDFVPSENEKEGNSVVKWYISNSASSGYTQISVEDEYYILPAHAGKYLTVEVTPKSENGISGKPVKSAAMGPLAKSSGPIPNQTSHFTDQKTEADPQYTFRVSGYANQFILLDEKDGKYFIGTGDSYGNIAFDTNGNVKFDPNDPANVGYYLNNSVLSGENSGNRIPQSVLDYIVRDTVWFTEAGNANSNSPRDYYTTAAISLMSYNEWKTYYNKFGFDNGYTAIGWWLRTPMGNGDVTKDMLAVRTNASTDFQGLAFQYGGSVALLVRPVFWVEGNFFENVKLDTETMGSEVKQMFLSKYSMDELSNSSAGYTKEELDAIGFDGAPTAEKLHISGIAAAGNEIGAAYLYTCETAEGKSRYKWLVSDSENGAYAPIENAEGRYLKLTDDLVGKYIKFSVIPKNEAGVGGMEAVCSEGIRISQKQPLNISENRLTDTLGEYPDLNDNVILWNAVVNSEAAELILITSVYGKDNRLISVQNREYSLVGGEDSLNMTLTRDTGDEAEMIQFILLDKDGYRPLSVKEIR